ncbi:hypothetical protein [Cypionkella sp.]|uniref:hypothetical protein n=1 Tax=Cypionkella sp. TaxID=2811411 RepID=UPI002ABBFC0E|nr:hypothetical protein [Cypionkella sp.]MDZ4393864.1 hypothetical protein [Cypionkella sp.]
MAAIATTTSQGSGQRTAVATTLGASDTFAYEYGKGQLLMLFNPTGGTINPTIVGDTAWNFTPAEVGIPTPVLAGYSPAVLAGQMIVINLDEERFLHSASNTITTGAGLIAILTL